MSGLSGRRASARVVLPQPGRFAPVFIETMKNNGFSGCRMQRRGRWLPLHCHEQLRFSCQSDRRRLGPSRYLLRENAWSIGIAGTHLTMETRSMKLHRRIKRITAVSLALLLGSSGGSSPTSAEPSSPLTTQYQTYFLDHVPTKRELARIPKSARDIIIAKVKIDMIFMSNRNPDFVLPDTVLPRPRKKYPLLAKIKIIDVLKGSTTIGSRLDVYFGSAEYAPKYPSRTRDWAREYFIISYLGNISNVSDDTG